MTRFSSMILAACAIVAATPASAREPSTLPLKRVRLYETGVGYFERSGALGGTTASLPVPASHLDDALKTLVVLSDDAKASVAGVEFGSSVSHGMARSLAGLPPDEAPIKLHALLKSLKGANAEIKLASGVVNGRIVELVEASESDLEECVAGAAPPKGAAPEGCVMQKQPTLVVLTKAGEIRRLRVADLVSVKPTDPGFSSRLGSALDALGDQSARMLKDLHVMAKSGKGVTLGYVAETPVWRVTYRLVIAEGKSDQGTLQGWALLHNDTDEDWRGVQIDLVNGRPDSFLFPLAAPRYARRELVTPDNPLSTMPQLMDQTPDTMWGDQIGDSYGAGGLGITGVGEGGGGRGEGIGLGSIGTLGHGAGTGVASATASSLLSVGNLASVSDAEGVEAGALFRYTLKQTVDLRAHGSALVPFLSDAITARRMAFFSSPNQSARSAVHITHQGKQTLPPGTLAVFADGGFAGEAALQRMKPKETAVVEFGEDLDVEMNETENTHEDETKLLAFKNDQLIEHFVRHHHVRYALENRSGSARDVFLKLAYVNNAKVNGADELAYDSKAGNALAVFKLGARTKLEKKLDVDEGLSKSLDAKHMTSRVLRELIASKILPERQRKIVMQASDRLLEAEVRRGALGKRGAELGDAEAETTRLREHARALGNARGTEEVVKRLLAAEDRAKSLRRRIGELKSEARAKERDALTTLAALGG